MNRVILLVLIGDFATSSQISPKWSASLFPEDIGQTALRYGRTPLLLSNCAGSVHLFLDEYAYLSKDDFITPMAPVSAPSDMLSVDNPVIQTAVVRSDSIVFLINGTLLILDSDSMNWKRAGGLDDYQTTTLGNSKFCCDYAWCLEWSDTLVAIVVGTTHGADDGNTDQNIFILRHTETTFSSLSLPSTLRGKQILSALPLLPWSVVTLLQEDQQDDGPLQHVAFHYVTIFNDDDGDDASYVGGYHNVSGMRPVSFTLESGDYRVVHLGNRFAEFILWGPREILYTKSAGQTLLKVSKDGADYLAADEFIQELIPGTSGDFAFVTTQGRLWYGRTCLETSIELVDILRNSNTSSASIFDRHGRGLCTMTSHRYGEEGQGSSYGNISLVYLSSDCVHPTEVIARLVNDTAPCPVLLLTASFGDEQFYLDTGNNLVLEAAYIPSLWQHTHIMVYPSNPNIIRVKTSLLTGATVGHGLSRIHVSANVSLPADNPDSGVDEYRGGLATVIFTTAECSLACQKNPSLEAHIVAGCPPGKSIRLRKQVTREKCDYLKNYVYTFKSDEYDPSFMEGTQGIDEDQPSLSIQYDYGTHGCPDLSYYTDGYRPDFDLYMGDELLGPMRADYALIEVHGVHVYQYTMTAKQAGCTRTPQSWVEMLGRQAGRPDPRRAWTRNNYMSCIGNEENATVIKERLPYQVMNAGSNNRLRWPQIKAIYVFNVTVLEPNYSYCDLRTQFAVEVYGALPASSVSAIKVMLVTCLLGFAGVAFVFCYYMVQLKDAEEEEKQAQKILQFPH